MDDESTQPATQQVLDPRRLGRNNSGLRDSDISDVICILHPSSPAAFRIVASTAENAPQHVLQNDSLVTFDENADPSQLEEQETFILKNDVANAAQDLALRFSSRILDTVLQFCFGRNPRSCDIVLDTDSIKRVSNRHFRIFVNHVGVLMLQDMSTNGTLVDEKHLKGKNNNTATRMLQNGSIIQIPSSNPDEAVKFIVRIPSRNGHYDGYGRKLETYLRNVALAEAAQDLQHQNALVARGTTGYQGGAPRPPTNQYGMHWDGGDEYNVVGLLGKGAFATVYRLATKLDGQYFAAKELEKKRFIKNGRLDQRLDNEMQIMKSIRHKNVVQYIGYEDYVDHLYIIMEYVPCGDLQGYLQRHAILPQAEAKLMSRQVLDALHYLHGKQITHRDIKPDNILIACDDPFTIKLSDFGLSKVVNTNETFLKTFCGTLLYCAPEVFPHYGEHVAKKGIKRRRSGGAHQGNFHSYSQSVDIWSYAAVLWLSLCGKPPFEGVVDQTGRGMFNKIMETHLDYSPLLQHGISPEAIDLLCRMLNTDPSQRPTEMECLSHPWLYDGTSRPNTFGRLGLRAIAEEEESTEAVTGQTEAFSQLSVNDREAGAGDEYYQPEEEVQFDSGDFDFLDPRESKRIKADLLVPRNQIRGQAATASSSPNLSFQFLEHESDCANEEHIVPQQPRQPRLFGEIGASALQSSGILGARTNVALAMQSNSDQAVSPSEGSDIAGGRVTDSFQERQITSDLFRSDGDNMAHPSLLGTESLVRDMNMESPNSGISVDPPSDAPSNEPQTPRTPDLPPKPSQGSKKDSQPQKSSQEVTPKPKKPFDRHIRLPLPTSLLYDPTDPKTAPNLPLPALPDTMRGSLQPRTANGTSTTGMTTSSAVPVTIPSEANLPRARLAKLTSTTDSFAPICLRINDRVTHWGRDPANTFVYPDRFDTRIPKQGIVCVFHAYGIEKEERHGRDWTTMPGLHTFIHTSSRGGIWVNGVKLDKYDSDGTELCGHLYTGDVITIFTDKDNGKGPESLRFVCEFYIGEAAGRRPANEPFKAIRAIEPPSI